MILFINKPAVLYGFQMLSKRFVYTIFRKELRVNPFCDVNIKLPFNIKIAPLDVYKYSNSDKIIISLLSDKESDKYDDLHYNTDEKTINIFKNSENFEQHITCSVEIPIKANIEVNSTGGAVNLSNFHGDYINVSTTSGNINAAKCYCKTIALISNSGNITCSNVIEAAEVNLKTQKDGNITTGRLQGLLLAIETDNGIIKTDSSYCDVSTFTTKTGHLNLFSTHKNCKIDIKGKGKLDLTGFDGTLEANIHEGDVNVQITRVENNSMIKINESGLLTIKLFPTCLENTKFRVSSKKLNINDDVAVQVQRKNQYTILNDDKDVKFDFLIDCPQSTVNIQTASMFDMFNFKPLK